MFNPGNQFSRDARSSPLHHPVSQHSVPSAHSASSSSNAASAYNNPTVNSIHSQYAPASATGMMNSQEPLRSNFGPTTAFNSMGGASGQNPQGPTGAGFGGFQQYLNDPSAQIGLSVGRNALNYGQEYIGKNVSENLKL